MGAFRVIAMAYALVVFLIAPAWLAADEQPSVIPGPVDAATETVREAAPEVPGLPLPAAEAQAPDEPDAKPEPKPEPKEKAEAEPAKSEKKQQQKTDEPTAKVAASASVTISDFKFTPATVTVNEGDTVTWTNDGPTVHTATADDGSFDTGALRKGESGSATFTQAGTISYICTPHPNMKGTVVVQGTSSSDGGSGSPGGSDGGSGDTGGTAGETTTSDDGSGLPSTGGETLSILLLGAATLGFGLLIRRRRES